MTAQAFKDQLISQVQAAADSGYLNTHRQQAGDLLQSLQLPDRRTESWKYASLNRLYQRELQPSSAHVHAPVDLGELEALEALLIQADENGVLQLPEASVAGLSLCRFSNADAAQQAVIEQHLGQIAQSEKHPFSVVNSALFNDGVLIHVAANAQLDQPILIDASGINQHWQTRVLVVVEQGAKATVLERQHVLSDVWYNLVTEVNVADNASLTHYRLAEPQADSQLIAGCHVAQHAHSRYTLHSFNLGGELHRLDLHVRLLGEGAESTINSVFSAQDKQQTDIRLDVEHVAAHCNSTENFRGLASGKGRCNFTGRIHIHPHAQKTAAMLSSKNILLSKNAEINAKPELEIYADDVTCAHGATVGQLDNEAVFYLRARGVSDAQARALLSHGFANELVMNMPHYAVRDYLSNALASLYPSS